MKYPISIQRTTHSKIDSVDFENLPFGKIFSDHMFLADYHDGKWQNFRITPFGNLSMHPATMGLHYGQIVWEGMKSYKSPKDIPLLFRPDQNAHRFTKSATRMAMPPFPEDAFIQAIQTLVELDKNWIPTRKGYSLYIRPIMYATDEYIGVRSSETYTMMIFTSPVGNYYSGAVKLWATDKYVRAFEGGTGFTKTSGNYGAALCAATEARKMGYDQCLWMDGVHHKYIHESGTMNVFMQLGDTIITPELSETILDGVTRKSLITLLRDRGLKVEERSITIDEVVEAYDSGNLHEMFGSGTAATIAPVSHLLYRDKEMVLKKVEERPLWESLKTELQSIQWGILPDRHNWIISTSDTLASV